MSEHIIEAEVEAWKQYKMRYSSNASDDVEYFEKNCETQAEVPGTYEHWECSCGETFSSGFKAEEHLLTSQEPD